MLDSMEAEIHPDFKWGPEVRAPALQWGKDHETLARNYIALAHDVVPVEPGFLTHPEVPILGATPDYFFQKNGLAYTGEIKCPFKPDNHKALLMRGVKIANPKYYVQVHGQLLISGADLAWFSSFDPRAAPSVRLSLEEFKPDLELCSEILEACAKLQSMLESGSRFGSGKTTTPSGILKLF